MLLWSLVLCSVLVEGWTNPTFPPSTDIPQGRLSGVWKTTRGGRTVAAFLGIPYAAPPVGQLRFEIPQPAKPWTGVYPAIKDAPACIQTLNPAYPSNQNDTSEDCLYLNVYTPNVKPPKNLPVLVFVYGGGFEIGSALSTAYGPDFLLDEDIVLVAMNYRVGILGFLALNDPVLPGNLGLKDQREALRWVRTNIAQFGGDPHSVTLWGESAGAACVQLHLQTSYHEGLFRAIILDSGSSLGSYSFWTPPAQKTAVDKLIQLTGCPGEPSQLVYCLRTLPAQDFPPLLEQLRDTGFDIKTKSPLLFPTLEPTGSKDAIIIADPWTIVTNVPILQGTNQDEGLLSLIGFETDKTDEEFRELNAHYQEVLAYILYIDETALNPIAVLEAMKWFYFGDSNIDRDHYINLIDCVSDSKNTYPMVVSARNNQGKTYVYSMDYKGSNTIAHNMGISAYIGVCHYDELYYLFPLGGPGKRNYTLQDTELSKKMVKMWTNFVKFLEPAPGGQPTTWTPVVSPSIEYLDISQYGFNMQVNFLKPRMDFWDNLPFRSKVEQLDKTQEIKTK